MKVPCLKGLIVALDDFMVLDAIYHYCLTICTVDDPYQSDEVKRLGDALRMVLEIVVP